MGNSKDEIQVACRTPEIANRCAEIAQMAMRKTQEHFKFHCQLDTEAKIGTNWYLTH